MSALPLPQDAAAATLVLLAAALSALQGAVGLYYVLVFLRAPFRRPAPLPSDPPSLRIAVLIPARDEERVVARAVRSALALDYPSGLLDVLVVADNCADGTAAAARSAGARTLERHDPDRRTKADALGWAFRDQGLLEAGYDAFCILDADNLLDPRFLRHAERRLREGCAVVQGRCEPSNPTGTFAASFSSLLVALGIRIWYVPLGNQGLSALHIGTGVALRADHLRRVGWSVRTLVEDTEFSLQTILAGETVAYCDEAVFLAEQPVDFRTLWRQQRRWLTGSLQLAPLYLPALVRRLRDGFDADAVTGLVKLILPHFAVVGMAQVLLAPFLALGALGTRMPAAALLAGGLLSLWLTGAVQAVLIRLLDGKRVLPVWRGILVFGLQPFFFGCVALASMVRPKRSWEPIAHGADIDADLASPLGTPSTEG